MLVTASRQIKGNFEPALLYILSHLVDVALELLKFLGCSLIQVKFLVQVEVLMVEDLSVKDLSIFLSDSIPGLGKLLAEDLSLLLLSEIGEEVDLVV